MDDTADEAAITGDYLLLDTSGGGAGEGLNDASGSSDILAALPGLLEGAF